MIVTFKYQLALQYMQGVYNFRMKKILCFFGIIMMFSSCSVAKRHEKKKLQDFFLPIEALFPMAFGVILVS